MARNAAYAVIDKDAYTLQIGNGGDLDHSRSFDLDSVATGIESILSYDVNPDITDGQDVHIEWELNNHVFLEQSFNTGDARTWQWVIDKNLLKETDNRLTTRLTDQDKHGKVGIQNVTLLYTQKA